MAAKKTKAEWTDREVAKMEFDLILSKKQDVFSALEIVFSTAAISIAFLALFVSAGLIKLGVLEYFIWIVMLIFLGYIAAEQFKKIKNLNKKAEMRIKGSKNFDANGVSMAEKNERVLTVALFIPAGIFIGFGAGFLINNLPAGFFLGMGAGFAAFTMAALMGR